MHGKNLGGYSVHSNNRQIDELQKAFDVDVDVDRRMICMYKLLRLCQILLSLIIVVPRLVLISPFRRAKLLLQVQWVHSDIPPERRYNGLTDCIRRVYKEQVHP